MITSAQLAPAQLYSEIKKTAQFISSQQLADGAIPWFANGKLDPWDHIEAAMGLDIAGLHDNARRAYRWLADKQLADGSWFANYFSSEAQAGDASRLKETNFIAYIATGVWHHYLITEDRDFLAEIFPTVKKALDFTLRMQDAEGDIAWAVDHKGNAQQDALVTGCSSILRSLECGIYCARLLNITVSHWHLSGRKLLQALRDKPYRFDRTWESKTRYAMDWYYPILAGVFSVAEAEARLNSRWHEFIKSGLGCRCVSDEPWVTMAETSELVIALIAANKFQEAQSLFTPLQRWSTEEGGYWTGYVYRDDAIWPEETTTWTAGAVLLAADAIFKITPAHSLFTKPSVFL